MTWYGYVKHSAASLDEPDMRVYAVLDYGFRYKTKSNVPSPLGRTSLSSSVVHSRPSLAIRRLLRSNIQFFIFS